MEPFYAAPARENAVSAVAERLHIRISILMASVFFGLFSLPADHARKNVSPKVNCLPRTGLADLALPAAGTALQL